MAPVINVRTKVSTLIVLAALAVPAVAQTCALGPWLLLVLVLLTCRPTSRSVLRTRAPRVPPGG